jgi:hypothetical protein
MCHGNSNYGIKKFPGPTFARSSLLDPTPIRLCRPSSFEDEIGAGKVPRNNRGSFIGPANSRGCLCTTPCAMKHRRRRRWCGASASSMIITTEPRRNPPPKIPEQEHQISGDSVTTNAYQYITNFILIGAIDHHFPSKIYKLDFHALFIPQCNFNEYLIYTAYSNHANYLTA